MQIEAELLGSFGSDLDVAYAAWASSGKQKKRSMEDVEKLLAMIIKDGHDSCLEHIIFRFKIEAPLYIMQQITRHRIASYNQSSSRYMYEFNEYIRVPDDVLEVVNTMDKEEYDQICLQALSYHKRMKEKYKNHPKRKRINEVLRGALPTATMSSLVMSINLRSWLNFYRLRSSEHAQAEIREVARQMKNQILRIKGLEIILKNLKECGRM